MPEEQRKDMMGLQTVSAAGEPPEKRLPTCAAATELVDNLIQASQPRNGRKASIQGLRDGNPPFNFAKMKDAGLKNLTNIPTMEADGLVCQAVAPYYDLFNATNTPIWPSVNFGEPEEQDDINEVIAQELHTLIKRWGGWHNQWWPMLNEFIWGGRGFFIFPDSEDWRFKWVEESNVMIPDDTTVDMEDWELVVVLQRLPVHKLWDKVNRGAGGWKKDQVINAIRNAIPDQPNGRDPVDVQRQFNEKSFLWENARVCCVHLANVFCREFSGKWSWLIVLKPDVGGTTNPVTPQTHGKSQDKLVPVTDFLYEGRDQYSEVRQFINPWLYEVTHRNTNELTGMGKKVAPLLGVNDRLFCVTTDGVFLRAGLTVQSQTAEASTKMGIVQLGRMNVLPPGLAIQPGSVLSDISAAVQHSEIIRGIVSANTGIYKPQVEKSDGNPPTAREYMGRQFAATRLTNSAVERFYDQADHFYRQLLLRVFRCSSKSGERHREAIEFRKRCLARGVPEDAFELKDGEFEHIECVEACRVPGNGNPQVREDKLDKMANVSMKFPEDGQEKFWQDYVATNTNYGKVRRWMGSVVRKQKSTVDESFAVLENAVIKIGGPVVRAPGQNDVIHAQTHLGFGATAAQALGKGADIQDVYRTIDGVGRHVAEHIAALKQDPSRKQVVKALEEQWKQLATIHDQIGERIQQQAAQQQADQQANQQADAMQQGMDGKTRLQAMQTQHKMMLQEAKTRQSLKEKQQKHQQSMQINAEKHTQELAIADATAAAEIQRNRLKAFQQQRDNPGA